MIPLLLQVVSMPAVTTAVAELAALWQGVGVDPTLAKMLAFYELDQEFAEVVRRRVPEAARWDEWVKMRRFRMEKIAARDIERWLARNTFQQRQKVVKRHDLGVSYRR